MEPFSNVATQFDPSVRLFLALWVVWVDKPSTDIIENLYHEDEGWTLAKMCALPPSITHPPLTNVTAQYQSPCINALARPTGVLGVWKPAQCAAF